MGAETLMKQLEAEYFHLQKTIEDFDNRSLLIKGWSVTFSLAQIGVGFTNSMPILHLIAALTALLFWTLETHWKCFQYAYGGRIKDIEAYFSDQTSGVAMVPFQITKRWYETYHAEVVGRFFEFARWPHVMVPHAVTVVLGIALFLLHLSK